MSSKGSEAVEKEKENVEEAAQAEGGGGDEVASDRNAQCYEMFEKVAEYLNGELAGECAAGDGGRGSLSLSPLPPATSEEYDLLQRLNLITLNKYQDMTALASRLNEVSQRLNDKCGVSPSLRLVQFSPSLQLCPCSPTATRLTRWRPV